MVEEAEAGLMSGGERVGRSSYLSSGQSALDVIVVATS